MQFAFAALAAVWAINFFVILPVLSPAFVHLVPYSVSLMSKLLFGFAAAETLRRCALPQRRWWRRFGVLAKARTALSTRHLELGMVAAGTVPATVLLGLDDAAAKPRRSVRRIVRGAGARIAHGQSRRAVA